MTLKNVLLALVGVFLIIGSIVAFLFVRVAWLTKPDAGAPITIEIKKDTTAKQLREILKKNNLASPFFYRIYASLDQSAKHPKPGVYQVRRGEPYQVIARILATGTLRTERSLRLVEGKTIDENSEALQSSGVDVAAYLRFVGRSRNEAPFDRMLIDDFPFLSKLSSGTSLEGYLFPDTYRVWEDELPKGLVEKQLQEFYDKVIKPNPDAERKTGMTWHEIITLASVVEGEVRTPEVRKIVAGIFLNRLKIGMALQSDATLNYVMTERNDRPTAKDLAIDSLYNTYDHPGLPPGPVGNPSISAIDAVLNPTETDYLYFLTDQKGEIYYAKTYDEHLKNKYRVYGE